MGIGKSAKGRSYAKGRRAIAECQRSGQKMLYRDLVEDGHVAGLLVHPDWWEPKHPQEIPVEIDDPIALYRPAPEISVPAGSGNPELGGTGTCPATPDTANFPATGVIAAALAGGETHMVSNTAVRYPFGECLFIALDAGGWFVSKIVTEADFPSFSIPFTSLFAGTATIGNSFYVGVDGAGGAKT